MNGILSKRLFPNARSHHTQKLNHLQLRKASSVFYNINAATIPAPRTPAMFIELREAAPVNCGGLGVSAPVPFGGTTLAKVVGTNGVVTGRLIAGAVGVP